MKLSQEDSDAFDVDNDTKVLVYASGDELIFHSLKVHEAIQKQLRYRY
jgi:hypothetical protein